MSDTTRTAHWYAANEQQRPDMEADARRHVDDGWETTVHGHRYGEECTIDTMCVTWRPGS